MERSKIWKYLGAMLTEEKAGVMAASFTRVLGITTFALCLTLWIVNAIQQSLTLPTIEVPGGLLTTLWTVIGAKGAKDVGKAFSGRSSYRSDDA